MGTDESAQATERLSTKLQDFYDALPEDEQALLATILTQAQDDDVSGFSLGDRVRIRVADDAYPESGPPGIVEILF